MVCRLYLGGLYLRFCFPLSLQIAFLAVLKEEFPPLMGSP